MSAPISCLLHQGSKREECPYCVVLVVNVCDMSCSTVSFIFPSLCFFPSSSSTSSFPSLAFLLFVVCFRVVGGAFDMFCDMCVMTNRLIAFLQATGQHGLALPLVGQALTWQWRLRGDTSMLRSQGIHNRSMVRYSKIGYLAILQGAVTHALLCVFVFNSAYFVRIFLFLNLLVLNTCIMNATIISLSRSLSVVLITYDSIHR